MGRRARLSNRLSVRQVEVMRLHLSGMSVSEIAEHLFISTGTVKSHRYAAYKTLGINEGELSPGLKFLQAFQALWDQKYLEFCPVCATGHAEVVADKANRSGRGPVEILVSEVEIGILSPQQSRVLRMLALGMDRSEMGEELGISVDTVRTHIGHVMRKLKARDRSHAVSIAYANGLLVARVQPGVEA